MVLVTGGSGFIGSHLIKRLVSMGVKPVNIDKKINKDIRYLDMYGETIHDWIYHLAANADVRGGLINTRIDLEENLLMTHNVLEHMRKYDITNLIFTSSAVVYGERGNVVLPENTPSLQPISHYGSSKLAAEKFISSYCHTHGLKAWIFRFGNIIGPGNTHGVIRDFVYKLKSNPHELEILGNGEQIKQYLHVNDCIDGLINLRQKYGKYPKIYNLAHHNHIRVKDLAKLIIEELNMNPIISYTGGDRGWKGDVPITILDVDKVSKLGWKPKIPLDNAIKETARWLYDNI